MFKLNYLSEVLSVFCSEGLEIKPKHMPGIKMDSHLMITNSVTWETEDTANVWTIKKSEIFFPLAVPRPLVLCVNTPQNDFLYNCSCFLIYAEENN